MVSPGDARDGHTIERHSHSNLWEEDRLAQEDCPRSTTISLYDHMAMHEVFYLALWAFPDRRPVPDSFPQTHV